MLRHLAAAAISETIPDYEPAGNEGGLQLSAGHFPSSAYLQRMA